MLEEVEAEEPWVGRGGARKRRTSKSEPVGPKEVLTSRETGSLRFDGLMDVNASAGNKSTS